jgi:anaerobic magnesium-protoporphyrin IX monomethyl ester cyclase
LNKHTNLKDKPVTVLIRPPISRWQLYKWYSPFGSREPSLGLLYIASYIQSNGYEVHILDGENLVNRELYNKVKSINPDLIGITSTTFSFFNASVLVEKLRLQFPDSLILLGGPHASALPEDSMMKISGLDGVVVGEGEETVLEIVQKVKTDRIRGLIWRDSSSTEVFANSVREPPTDLDKFELNWKLLDKFPQKYSPPYQSKKKNSTSLVVSRGCLYDCSFCSSINLWGKKIRFHSPEYVVKMMIELEKEYGINDFYFHDDYFPVYPTWIKQFCNLVLKQKKSFTWSCASRVEVLSREILSVMRYAGCRQIGVGVESGSQKVLVNISKKVSIPVLTDGLNRISSSGMDVKGYFMLDTPGESFTDLLKTIKFIFANKFSSVQFNYYAPLPGSIDYNKLNVPEKLWKRMSLQHCLGYSKINPILYPFIEISLYLFSYLKIIIYRIKTRSFSLSQ